MTDYEIPLQGGVIDLGNTAGTTGYAYGGFVLVGGANITLSQSLAGGVATITIVGAAGGGGGGIAAAAGTQTLTNNTLIFSDLNGISFGLNNSTLTASYTVPSVAGLLSNIRLSAGTTSNLASAFTFADSNGINFGLNAGTITASHNGLTSQSNQNALASNGNFNFQTLSFSNANGISFGTSAGSAIFASHNGITSQSNQQLTLFAVGNTTQSSTGTQNASSLVFRGEGIASVGITGGSVLISVPAGGGAAFSAGVSNLGNTAGDTGITGTRLILVGGANITLSQATDANGATVSFIGGAGGGGITAVNISAGTTNTNVSNFSFADANLVSFGIDGSTITAKVGGNTITRSFTDVVPQGSISTFGQLGNGSFWVNFLPIDGNISVSRMNHVVSFSISSSTNSSHAGTLSMLVGIYTRTGSTLSLLTSGSGTYAWTNTSNNSTSVLASGRLVTAAIPFLFTEGDYWIAVGSRTSTANANWWTGSNMIVGGGNNPNLIGHFMSATTVSIKQFPGQGFYSATSSVPPASMAFSHIQASSAAMRSKPIFNLGDFFA